MNIARCHCFDKGCPVHKGQHLCPNKALVRVYRVDMHDRTGTQMCEGCANDALDSGVFATHAVNKGPAGQAVG